MTPKFLTVSRAVSHARANVRCLVILLPLVIMTGLADSVQAATVDILGPGGAEVLLDGAPLGLLPLAGPVTLTPGPHRLSCDLPGYVVYRQQLVLKSDQDHLILTIRLTPLSRRTAVGSNLLLAGLGQRYLGHGTRAWLYHGAEIGGLLSALAGELGRSNHRKDYLLLRDKYDHAINADELRSLRTATNQAYADMQDMENLRNTALAVAGGVIVLSMIDAWLSFPHITAGSGTLPTTTASSPLNNQPALHAGLCLGF